MLSFCHELPCVLSFQCAVQAAHISFARPELGHYGRGKGTKVSDRWILPLSPTLHMEQHAHGDERGWWESKGVEPHLLCLAIYGIFKEIGPEDGRDEAERIIRSGFGRHPYP